MEQSPRLSLPYVQPAQAQKHVTVNESFRRLDALTQLTVLSQTIAAEPGAPAEGVPIYFPPVRRDPHGEALRLAISLPFKMAPGWKSQPSKVFGPG
ncbi:MAG: DUF2793 domain-containing protein [Marinicaulis sp.]|nr:DUF2793 domain-containing protein [Marinicaulis sp.]